MPYQNTLSQDEVDALLTNITGKDSTSAKKSTESANGVRSYDLTSPDRVVRHRMQTLELINERFARRLRSDFFSFMRRNADVTVNGIRIQKYSDFERNLPLPSNLNMVSMKPLRGAALFTFDPNLVFLVIDNLFGGHGRYNTRIEGRNFTTTEQRIILRLLNLTLECYGTAWQTVHPIKLEYIRSEMHTKFARISSGNDIAVVSSFNIELGATGGKLNICLPYSMIEPLRDLLTRPLQQVESDSTDQRWAQQLSREVRSAEVELIAEFTQIKTTIAELTDLSVNDVLPINIPPTIVARVGDVPLLECGYGTFNDCYALRVHKVLANPSNYENLLAGMKK